MKFKLKATHKGKTYTVELIDFVNKRVAFTTLTTDLEKKGVHAGFDEVEITNIDSRDMIKEVIAEIEGYWDEAPVTKVVEEIKTIAKKHGVSI